jgi:hypothetical protein
VQVTRGSIAFGSALAIACALAIGLAISGVVSGGIGWDSVFDLTTANLFLNLPAGATLASLGELVPAQDLANGVLRYRIALGLGGIFGLSPELNPDDFMNFILLGLATVGTGVVAVGYMALVIRVVTGSWIPGLAAASITLVTPLWLGLSMVAYRDIPVAAGLTLVASGAALLISQSARKSYLLLAGLGIALGTLLAVAARGGAIGLVSFLLLASLVPLLSPANRKDVGTLIRKLALALVASFTGTALSVMTNPVSKLDPISWFMSSISLASSNPNQVLVKVASRDVLSDELPWWYIPAYLAANLPLLTSLVILGALLILIMGMRSDNAFHFSRPSVATWPFIVLAFVIPFGLILAGVSLYDGLRHVVFIIPGLAALIGFALHIVLQHRRQGLRQVGSIFILGTVVLSLYADFRWHPYEYAFVNPAAGLIKEPRIWDLDYWGLTAREGVALLREQGAVNVGVIPTANVATPWGGIELSAEERLAGALPAEIDAVYVFARWSEDLPAGCARTFELRRDGHLLGWGGTCR